MDEGGEGRGRREERREGSERRSKRKERKRREASWASWATAPEEERRTDTREGRGHCRRRWVRRSRYRSMGQERARGWREMSMALTERADESEPNTSAQNSLISVTTSLSLSIVADEYRRASEGNSVSGDRW